MLFSEIKTMLGQTGLPNTYYSWPESQVPALPYLVWYLPSSDNFPADDKVYKRVDTLNIELYTKIPLVRALGRCLSSWISAMWLSAA